MRIKDFREKFISALKTYYPETEIFTFFNRLAEAYLGMKRIDITLNPERKLTETEQKRLKTALNRLKIHEPLQYILGETEFYGLRFLVNKNVLIPRPETEELVDWIVTDFQKTFSAARKNEAFKILDIGTGSGCIAVSLAKNLPQAQVFGLDFSKEALEMAKKNAALNSVEIEFIHADILEIEILPQQFDIIVSNPPYVRQLEKAELQPNVLNHEPALALFVSDQDALVFYRKIAAIGLRNLVAGGLLYFEINEYLEAETRDLVAGLGYKEIVLQKDIFGKPRILKAIKP
jgi:release factor glutamine methyltransferase